MFIYVITCSLNGKQYVGYDTGSADELRRWKLHCALKKPRHESKIFNAMSKYGVDNFTVDVVQQAESNEELKQLEIDWIKRLDTIKNGYNIRTGGQGFGKLSEMNPEDASKQLEAIKRGSRNANVIRWAGKSVEERKQILKKCHESYSSEARSENMKRIWAERRAANGL